jgi:S-adenosylmethionine decarboxylase
LYRDIVEIPRAPRKSAGSRKRESAADEERCLVVKMTGTESNDFTFSGKHLMLSFVGCKVDLDDMAAIRSDMVKAIQAVGASILGQAESRFTPHGVSIVFLLAESHASIHTYPEHNACFLDIFTCGRTLRIEAFSETLQRLWRPEHVSIELKERS